MHTGAAVLPAFTIWDEALGKYRIRFEPAIPPVCSGDDEADVVANTQNYTTAIEQAVRGLSRPVAVGAPALEDASRGRSWTVLKSRFRDCCSVRNTAARSDHPMRHVRGPGKGASGQQLHSPVFAPEQVALYVEVLNLSWREAFRLR